MRVFNNSFYKIIVSLAIYLVLVLLGLGCGFIVLKPSNFTIVVLPDTQHYSESYPQIFEKQTQWVVESKDRLNTQAAIHLGDVVDDSNEENQWLNALGAVKKIRKTDLPFLIAIGNHDYYDQGKLRDSRLFNKYFGINDYKDTTWFKGGFYSNKFSENLYFKKRIEGVNYLFLILEYGSRGSVVNWANEVVSRNIFSESLIITHAYMHHDNSRQSEGSRWNPKNKLGKEDVNDGQDLWDKLVSKHSNIFMVTSGHVLGDGVSRRTDVTSKGNSVHQILSNYQMLENGGNGWLRYYIFKPQENKIDSYTYSPYLDKFWVSDDHQFTLDFDFEVQKRNFFKLTGILFISFFPWLVHFVYKKVISHYK